MASATTDYLGTLAVFMLLLAITCAGIYVLTKLYVIGEKLAKALAGRLQHRGH